MKHSVLGVLVDATDYDRATSAVLEAARDGRPFALTALAVHGVMTGVQDRAHGGARPFPGRPLVQGWRTVRTTQGFLPYP